MPRLPRRRQRGPRQRNHAGALFRAMAWAPMPSRTADSDAAATASVLERWLSTHAPARICRSSRPWLVPSFPLPLIRSAGHGG